MQNVTGLYINHYMGIGFGGFVNVVNAVGGVRMCLPGPMVDPKAGLNLKTGCQTLDGAQALGYVRTRNFAISDLQREQDQRLFLKALLAKMTSPACCSTRSRPPGGERVREHADRGPGRQPLPAGRGGVRAENPQTTTVPIANADYRPPTAWPCSGIQPRRCGCSTR